MINRRKKRTHLRPSKAVKDWQIIRLPETWPSASDLEPDREMPVHGNHSYELRYIGLKLFYAYLFALILTRLALPLSGLNYDFSSQAVTQIILLSVLALTTWFWQASLITLAAVSSVSFLLWIFFQDSWINLTTGVQSAGNWCLDAILWFTGQSGIKPGDDVSLALTMGLFICFAAYWLVARYNSPWLMLIGLIILGSLQGRDNLIGTLPWLFIGFMLVMAAMSRKQNKVYTRFGWQKPQAQNHFMRQAFFPAVAMLIIASILSVSLPQTLFYSSTVDGVIRDLSDLVTTPWQQQRVFREFTLNTSGYYPLVDRLGGPVRLSTERVMTVAGTTRAMLLKGSVSQQYDGFSWRKIFTDSPYRFDSPIYQEEQQQIFDLAQPDFTDTGLLPESFRREINYTIIPLVNHLQIIFLAGRPTTVRASTRQFPLYFGQDGVLYSQQWVDSDNPYTVTAWQLAADQISFQETMVSLEERMNNDLSSITAQAAQAVQISLTTYLQMPDLPEYGPEGVLTEQVKALTENEPSDYRKALKIAAWLQQTCRYNLTVAVPPADEEFVSWFLQTKEGYCVYFATAEVMLCRLSGIPARYVEGYAVQATTGDPAIPRVVTGEQAHAWCEIYLIGIGWIPVDATPGGAGSVNLTDDPSTAPDPTPEVTKPALSPSPAANSTPGVTPGADRPDRPDGPDSILKISPQVAGILLVLLLLATALILCVLWIRKRGWRKHDLHWLNKAFPTDHERIVYIWHDLKRLWRLLGYPIAKEQTPRLFHEKLKQQSPYLGGRDEQLEHVLLLIEQTLYGQKQPTGQEMAELLAFYQMVEMTVRQNLPLPAWLLKRFFRP